MYNVKIQMIFAVFVLPQDVYKIPDAHRLRNFISGPAVCIYNQRVSIKKIKFIVTILKCKAFGP